MEPHQDAGLGVQGIRLAHLRFQSTFRLIPDEADARRNLFNSYMASIGNGSDIAHRDRICPAGGRRQENCHEGYRAITRRPRPPGRGR